MDNYKEKLKKHYRDFFRVNKNNPNWAVKKKSSDERIHPAIPFVGKSYENTKFLLYASAENLIYYEKNPKDNWLDNDESAINRRNLSNGGFFPDIHISPVNDGSLLVVAAYILDKLKIHLDYSNPYEFIENIAIDNFCKFSIKTPEDDRTNKDYVKDESKLSVSYDYVKSDLEILKPNILVIPKTIFDHYLVQKIIKTTLPNCLILPIYQINSSNINRIISPKFEKKSKNEIPKIMLNWQENLSNGITGQTNLNFYSVYTYLDTLLKDSKM